MFLIDTDLLHDYFGLNAYKNNKRAEGGEKLWNGSVIFLSLYWKTGRWALGSID